MTDREQAINFARVYLTEARNRRGQRFSWTLLAWARNARLRAMRCSEPVQGGLFG